MAKRKPSVYRKIRGIRDDEIRQMFQHLFNTSADHEKRITELHTLATAMVVRVFPEKVAELEAKRAEEAAKVAAEASAPICTFCHGLGYFEYTRPDGGGTYNEKCLECQPEILVDSEIPDPPKIQHGLGAVEDDAIETRDAGA